MSIVKYTYLGARMKMDILVKLIKKNLSPNVYRVKLIVVLKINYVNKPKL